MRVRRSAFYRTTHPSAAVRWSRLPRRGDVFLVRVSVGASALHLTIQLLNAQSCRASFVLPHRAPVVSSALSLLRRVNGLRNAVAAKAFVIACQSSGVSTPTVAASLSHHLPLRRNSPRGRFLRRAGAAAESFVSKLSKLSNWPRPPKCSQANSRDWQARGKKCISSTALECKLGRALPGPHVAFCFQSENSIVSKTPICFSGTPRVPSGRHSPSRSSTPTRVFSQKAAFGVLPKTA